MRMKFNISTFYILAWILYYLQGLLPSFFSPIARVLLLSNLAVSIYYVYVANSKFRLPVYFKGLNLMLIMFTIYGIILIIDPRPLYKHDIIAIDKFSYLKSIYLSLLPIYSFYVFARRGLIQGKDIKRWFFVFIPFMIVIYFYRQHQAGLAAMMSGADREEFTNNAGYMFLAIMPTVAFFKKKPFLQYAFLALCMLFTLMSMKRGAIIIGAFCVFIFLCMSIKTAPRNRKWWIFTLSIGMILVVYYYVQYMLNTSDYFNSRIEATMEGYSSQRDVIYSSLWEIFTTNTNALQILVGGGACATLRYIGSYAHNDWLELLINQGVVGVLIYALYWICFFKSYRRAKNNPTISLVLLLLIIINFMKTLFSMSYDDMVFYETMVLGYCLANFSVNYEHFDHNPRLS